MPWRCIPSPPRKTSWFHRLLCGAQFHCHCANCGSSTTGASPPPHAGREEKSFNTHWAFQLNFNVAKLLAFLSRREMSLDMSGKRQHNRTTSFSFLPHPLSEWYHLEVSSSFLGCCFRCNQALNSSYNSNKEEKDRYRSPAIAGQRGNFSLSSCLGPLLFEMFPVMGKMFERLYCSWDVVGWSLSPV